MPPPVAEVAAVADPARLFENVLLVIVTVGVVAVEIESPPPLESFRLLVTVELLIVTLLIRALGQF